MVLVLNNGKKNQIWQTGKQMHIKLWENSKKNQHRRMKEAAKHRSPH